MVLPKLLVNILSIEIPTYMDVNHNFHTYNEYVYKFTFINSNNCINVIQF